MINPVTSTLNSVVMASGREAGIDYPVVYEINIHSVLTRFV